MLPITIKGNPTEISLTTKTDRHNMHSPIISDVEIEGWKTCTSAFDP